MCVQVLLLGAGVDRAAIALVVTVAIHWIEWPTTGVLWRLLLIMVKAAALGRRRGVAVPVACWHMVGAVRLPALV